MAKSPVTATEEMSLEEALYLMQKYKVRRLPVVRGENDLCEMIAMSHFLQAEWQWQQRRVFAMLLSLLNC
jgi:CBS domain-containing protein